MTFIVIFITAVISVMGFRDRSIVYRLSLDPYAIVRRGEWWRVVSHAFVHGDMTHLLVNMFVLFSFGQNVEHMFKMQQHIGEVSSASLTFVMLYCGGFVLAALFDVIRYRNNPNYSSIGASASVSAVVFTSIFYSPMNSIYLFAIIPIPGILFGLLYLAYESYSAKRGSSRVNHYAHIVGAVYGFVFPIMVNPSDVYRFLNTLQF